MRGGSASSAGRRRLLGAGVALVVALTACGPGATPAGTGRTGALDGVGRAALPSGGNPTDALARWRSFPVSADPRPLVLTGGEVLDPATGFRTSEDKLAYLAGRFELGSSLPPSPVASAGYRLITARAALARLRATGSKQQPTTAALRISQLSLGQTTFGTDRGPRMLPAWRFALDQVSDPVWVLAVDPKQLWQLESAAPTSPDYAAGLSADGRSLTYRFFGSRAGPSPCGAEYAGHAAESGTAVVVSIREISPNPAGSSSEQACALVAAQRTVTVRLAAPLGARVLVSSDGGAVPVTSR